MVATLSTQWGDRRSGGDSASDQESGVNSRQLATSGLDENELFLFIFQLNSRRISLRRCSIVAWDYNPVICLDGRRSNDRSYRRTIWKFRGSARYKTIVLSTFARTTRVARRFIRVSRAHDPGRFPCGQPANFARVLRSRRLFAVCKTIASKIRTEIIKKEKSKK